MTLDAGLAKLGKCTTTTASLTRALLRSTASLDTLSASKEKRLGPEESQLEQALPNVSRFVASLGPNEQPTSEQLRPFERAGLHDEVCRAIWQRDTDPHCTNMPYQSITSPPCRSIRHTDDPRQSSTDDPRQSSMEWLQRECDRLTPLSKLDRNRLSELVRRSDAAPGGKRYAATLARSARSEVQNSFQ